MDVIIYQLFGVVIERRFESHNDMITPYMLPIISFKRSFYKTIPVKLWVKRKNRYTGSFIYPQMRIFMAKIRHLKSPSRHWQYFRVISNLNARIIQRNKHGYSKD